MSLDTVKSGKNAVQNNNIISVCVGIGSCSSLLYCAVFRWGE